MGVAASKDNDDLTDNLVKHGQIVSKEVELVFRLVDRGRFFPIDYVDEAYRDNPFKVPAEATGEWTPGKLHISAPSMYATVLEKLDLKPGHAFLNVGSGTGWLSTAAGFLIGGSGINHGVEIHENLIKFAEEKLAETIERPEVCAFPWTKPAFFHGNGLAQEMSQTAHLYDRVYCGAAVSDEDTVNRLIKLLEIGGKLIVPIRNSLMAYTRTGENTFSSQVLMACQFADLLPPKEEDRRDCLPCLVRPPSLADLCRDVIRASLRKNVLKECPVFMRSIVDESIPSGPDNSSQADGEGEMGNGQNHDELNIIRHPIRVELFRNLGAARIRLEGHDRARREQRGRDVMMRDIVTVQLQDGERANGPGHGDTDRDFDFGAGMFVFADEGPPADDEELDDDDRMGLHWLNAILGFEREARGLRDREREGDRERSASLSDDSSSDTSVDEGAADGTEEPVAEASSEMPEEKNNSSNEVNGSSQDNEGNSSNEVTSMVTDSADVKAEDVQPDPEESNNGHQHQESESNGHPHQEETENNGHDEQQGEPEPEPEPNADEDANGEDRNWESFPRDVMDLREFLASNRNNRGRADRNNRNNNDASGSNSTRRPRPSVSRRSAKRARIADGDNNDDEVEKQAEEERDKQHASLKNFGEAFNEAMWKLPLPKHLIKYIALHSIAPMFATDQTCRWR
ncbi:hypothetical protein V3C99_005652 [Haemonchus contortus]